MLFKKNEKSSMEQEIFEQPKILEHLMKTYVNDDNFIMIDVPVDISKIVLVASGSSYHCARYSADLFGDIADIEARAMYSSEFLLKSIVPHDNDILYVFITQSGETSDTNKALNRAKEFKVRTMCVTNKIESTIWQASDFKIDCHAGEEKSIAATKSLTSQMLCLTLLVLKYANVRGIDISGHINYLKRLSYMVEKTFTLKPRVEQLAKFLCKFKNMVVTADGTSYALAKEASLKIKETSYINVVAMILGEFMHGHVAVLNNKAPLIYITDDELSYTAIKNLNKIKEDYNPPICIIGSTNDKINSNYNIDIHCESPIVKSFCVVVIAQLLALEVAGNLGRNVDKPKGLHKVVV